MDEPFTLAAYFEYPRIMQVYGSLLKCRFHKFFERERAFTDPEAPEQVLLRRQEQLFEEIKWLKDSEVCTNYLNGALDSLCKNLSVADVSCSVQGAWEAFRTTFTHYQSANRFSEESFKGRFFQAYKRGGKATNGKINPEAWKVLEARLSGKKTRAKKGFEIYKGLHKHNGVDYDVLTHFTGNFTQGGMSSNVSKPGFFEFLINLIPQDTDDEDLEMFAVEIPKAGQKETAEFDRSKVVDTLNEAWNDSLYGTYLSENRSENRFGMEGPRFTELALGYLAIAGDRGYFDPAAWIHRNDFSFENVGMHYAQHVLKMPIKSPLRSEGAKMIFGPARGDQEDPYPENMTRDNFEGILEILETNGPELEEVPSFLEKAQSSLGRKRQRSSFDNNSGHEERVEPQMVTPTAPRQTQPGSPERGRREAAGTISLISPSPDRPVTAKKSDNTLLFIGVAALAGFFLVK